MTDKPIRAALYARVSTADQTCENQLLDLHHYCASRGWTVIEYVDTGVSGAKTSRPRLDQLMADALGRRVDVVVCRRLDRFGRNLRHLITAIEELNAAGVSFVSLGESIDTASPTGRLLLGVLGSFAQFERDRIRERITAGLARAKRQGQKLGRRRQRISGGDLERVAGLSVREAAKRLGGAGIPRAPRTGTTVSKTSESVLVDCTGNDRMEPTSIGVPKSGVSGTKSLVRRHEALQLLDQGRITPVI